MHAHRTFLAKDILVEFFPPFKRPTDKVVILCDGMPSLPSKQKLMEFLANQGYWVFHMRYRGTWESGGIFLTTSPEKDVTDVIDALKKPFTSAWTGEQFQVIPSQIIVMGVSFGGTAAILASLDKRVDKAVAVAPVVDWAHQSETEPLDELYQILQNGYGEAYRVSKKDWKKLGSNGFFQPVAHLKDFDPDKLLLIHARDDKVTAHDVAKAFASEVGSGFLSRRTGGHLSSTIITRKLVWRKVKRFLRT